MQYAEILHVAIYQTHKFYSTVETLNNFRVLAALHFFSFVFSALDSYPASYCVSLRKCKKPFFQAIVYFEQESIKG